MLIILGLSFLYDKLQLCLYVMHITHHLHVVEGLLKYWNFEI
jgi:hypothetical protein